MRLSVKDWEKINNFLLSIGSAQSVEVLNTILLDTVSELVPFERPGILIELGSSLIPRISASVNSEQKWNDLFNGYYHTISKAPDLGESIFSADNRILRDDFNREYYHDFIIPQDISFSAGLVFFSSDNRPTHSLVLNRGSSERMYTEKEITLLKIISPHISSHYRNLQAAESLHSVPVVAAELEHNRGVLSRREGEIAMLLLRRLRPSDIARRLDISLLTVRKHIQNIYQKLEVSDRKQLLQRIHNEYRKNR